MVVRKEPKTVFDELQKYFRFKTLEVSKYYQGIDYHPGINAWDLPCMDLGSHTYVKECVMKVSDTQEEGHRVFKLPFGPQGTLCLLY